MKQKIKRWLSAIMTILLVTGLLPQAEPQQASAATISSSWYVVGTAGFSEDFAVHHSLYVYNGTPYVAYADKNKKVTVKKYDGNSWVTVGSAGFSAGDAHCISLYVYGGTPYVAYRDFVNQGKVTVMKYNGSNWAAVGSAAFSAGDSFYTSLFVYNGTPYVAYQDRGNSTKATVMKYDGSNWVTVGKAGFSTTWANYTSLYVYNGIPYVAYVDGGELGTTNKATVMKYNGSNWVTVGSAEFSPTTVDYISLYMYNGTPYVAYRDKNNYEVTVMKYDGSNWVTVGNADFTPDGVYSPSLYVYEGTPYVAFADGSNANKATVMKYNGSNWVTVGSGGISASSAYNTSLYVDNGTPYVLYGDAEKGNKETVMVYLQPLGALPNLTMTSQVVGYTAGSQETKTVTLTRNAAVDITNLSVSLSGMDAGKFNITQPATTTLNDSTASTTFTVKSKDNLPTGIYTATVSVSANDMDAQTFTVTQTVDPRIDTIAGTGTAGYTASDDMGGYPPEAKLNGPFGVSVDSNDNVYIADTGNNRIRYMDNASGTISTIAGTGANSSGADGVLATAVAISGPKDVVIDSEHNLYFTDGASSSSKIRQLPYQGWQNGRPTWSISTIATSLNYPYSVATDSDGNVYYSVKYSNRVYKWTKTTNTVSVFAGNGTSGFTGDGGAATSAKLSGPYGVCVDSSGNVYISDNGNSRIRKVDTSGIITTVAGTGTKSYSGDGGLATAAQINDVYDLCTDAAGNLYFADTGNNRIRKINVSAGIITTVAGTGTAGFSGDGEAATSAMLNFPKGIAVDNLGNLYVADTSNNRIRKVTVAEGNSSAATYTVSFDSQGGSNVAAITDLESGSIIMNSDMPTPTRSGYDFYGWYKEAACTNAWVFNVEQVMDNITLYAKWTEKTYTVTYDGNGSDGGSVPVDSNHYTASQPVTIASSGDLTRTGYIFTGWATHADGSGSSVPAGITVPISWGNATDGITLYAQWTANTSDTYTVAFDPQGGSTVASLIGVVSGSAISASSIPDPTRAGYTFGGWYKEAAYTNAWNFSTDTVTSDIILYAKWTANTSDTYTVNFDSQGGSTVASLIGVVSGSAISATGIPDPTRAGYTFGGWYKEAAYTNAWNFSTDTVTADITLYAKWTANTPDTYTVSFDCQGGSTVASIGGVNSGATITEPTAPTRTGYTFGGWYKEAAYTNAWNFSTDKVTADVTLYAKWTENMPDTYTVSFDPQGGSAVASIGGVNSGTKITEPTAPTRSSYTFGGWYKEAVYTNIWNFGTDTVTADVTLYAKWTANPSNNGGSSTGGSGASQTTESSVETIIADIKQGNTDNTAARIEIKRKTGTDGIKSDAVIYQEDKAGETVRKLKEEGGNTARIVIPDTKGEVSETTITIPSKSITTLSDGEINLQIDTTDVKVDIARDTLKDIGQTSGNDLYFRVVPVKDEVQKESAKGNAKLAAVAVSGNSDSAVSIVGNPVTIETNVPSTEADITVPLYGITIPTDPVEQAAFLQQLAVYIEHSDGDKELVQGKLVEYRDGIYGIKVHINKFSTFTVVKTDAFEKSSEKGAMAPIKVQYGFYPLLLIAKGGDGLENLTFTKVSGADGYVVYGAPCGLNNHLVKIADLKADTTGYKITGLKANTYYKYQVKAYKLVNGKKVLLAVSKLVHSTTTSKYYANPTKVTGDVSVVSLKVGKAKTLKCDIVLPKYKINNKHTDIIRYETTNKAIAVVDSNGKITAKAKGTCDIYAYAQNGVYKKIKVTVK